MLLVIGFLQLVSGFNQSYQVNDQKKISQVHFDNLQTRLDVLGKKLSRFLQALERSKINKS